MNLLRRTKTDTVANRQPRQHRHHHDDNAVDHEKKSQNHSNNNKLRRTKTTEPSAVVSPRKDKPTRTKSNEEVAMRIRRTKTDATPTTKHTKKDRRMTDIQAMKQMKNSSRQTSQGVAAGVMAGAMREMDPQSIIDMLEAYAGDDDDRDMAANCLENLKKFGQGDCGEPVAAITSPRKSGGGEVRHSRSKRTSKDGKLRNSTGSTTSTASSSTGRPSLGEVKGDWASVSISELLGE